MCSDPGMFEVFPDEEDCQAMRRCGCCPKNSAPMTPPGTGAPLSAEVMAQRISALMGAASDSESEEEECCSDDEGDECCEQKQIHIAYASRSAGYIATADLQKILNHRAPNAGLVAPGLAGDASRSLVMFVAEMDVDRPACCDGDEPSEQPSLSSVLRVLLMPVLDGSGNELVAELDRFALPDDVAAQNALACDRIATRPADSAWSVGKFDKRYSSRYSVATGPGNSALRLNVDANVACVYGEPLSECTSVVFLNDVQLPATSAPYRRDEASESLVIRESPTAGSNANRITFRTNNGNNDNSTATYDVRLPNLPNNLVANNRLRSQNFRAAAQWFARNCVKH